MAHKRPTTTDFDQAPLPLKKQRLSFSTNDDYCKLRNQLTTLCFEIKTIGNLLIFNKTNLQFAIQENSFIQQQYQKDHSSVWFCKVS